MQRSAVPGLLSDNIRVLTSPKTPPGGQKNKPPHPLEKHLTYTGSRRHVGRAQQLCLTLRGRPRGSGASKPPLLEVAGVGVLGKKVGKLFTTVFHAHSCAGVLQHKFHGADQSDKPADGLYPRHTELYSSITSYAAARRLQPI